MTLDLLFKPRTLAVIGVSLTNEKYHSYSIISGILFSRPCSK